MPVSNFINNDCCGPLGSPVVGDAKPDASLKVGSKDLSVSVQNSVYESARLAHRSESDPGCPSRLMRSSTATVQKRDAWQAGRAKERQGAELLSYVTLKQQKNEQAPALPERTKGGSLSKSVESLASGYDVVRSPSPVLLANAYLVVAIDQLNFDDERIGCLESEIKSAQGQLDGAAPTIEPFCYEHEATAESEHAYDQTSDPYYEELGAPRNNTTDEQTSVSGQGSQPVSATAENEAVYSPAELDARLELDGEGLKLLHPQRDKRSGFIAG